jgi:hypothetical protein
MANRFGNAPEAKPGDDKAFPRAAFIKDLNELTRDTSTPMVFALHGPWGTGKTHLLKTWCKELDGTKRPYVYYNAWEHDHGDDPFVSFVGEIHQAALTKVDDNLLATLVEKAVKAAPGLLKVATRVALGLGCRIAGVDKDILSGADLYSAMEEQIKTHAERRASIETFKGELSNLAVALGEQYKAEQSVPQAPPLLILVDELDRCRPDFAIALLERVKHVLSVRGVVFLFAVDMDQLSHTAKCLYGQGMDTEGYFRRFFDVVLCLPYPDMAGWLKYVQNSAEDAVQATPSLRFDGPLFAALCKMLGISLRESAQLLTSMRLFMLTTPNLQYPDIILFLLALRAKHPEFYRFTPGAEAKMARTLFNVGDKAKELISYHDQMTYIGLDFVCLMLARGVGDGNVMAFIEAACEFDLGKATLEYHKSTDKIRAFQQDAKIWKLFIARIDLLFPTLSGSGG